MRQRLIDADALIIELMDRGIEHLQTDDFHEIQQTVDDAPTVDAVPVVRCKNCIACRKQDDYEYWCTAQSPAYLVAKDGFCSRGNRIKCSNAVCGYCQDGSCYNDHEMRVVHVCPRGYGKEKDDER
jgi:hypothetical protein